MTAAVEEVDIFLPCVNHIARWLLWRARASSKSSSSRLGGAGEELRHCPTRERERESDDDDALKSTVDVESNRFPPVVKEFEYFPCHSLADDADLSLSLSLSLCLPAARPTLGR
jgi:hypothetical protein